MIGKKPTANWHIKYEVWAARGRNLERTEDENINGATERFAKYRATCRAQRMRIGDSDIMKVTLENLHTGENHRRELQVGFHGGRKTLPIGDWHK